MSESATVLLINRAIITNGNSLLLLQRSQFDSYNPGLWEFPGGKVDSGEGLEVGLMREVYEETGLRIELVPPIVHIESELATSPKYRGRLYVALFHAAIVLDGDVVLSDEHDGAEWVNIREVTERELTNESRGAVESFIASGRIR